MVGCRWLSLTTVCFIGLATGVCSAQPQGFQKLEIGQLIPKFDLPGIDGKNYQLEDFEDSKLLMVIFTCNHCPTAQAYESRIKQLHKDYQDREVQLIAITPNDPQAVRLDELGYSDVGDGFEETQQRAEETGFEFPYLFDGETQTVSLAFGVLATPHVFIFDQDRRLRYKGRIDDSEVETVKSQDARHALEALLAGEPVPVSVTRPFGCSTKWFTKRESAKQAVEKWDREPVELSLLSPNELKKLAENRTNNYRLINVWATWCAPCIEELSEFVTINRMYRNRNFEMITISADSPDVRDDVINTLKKQKVACRNFIFDSDDRDQLFDGLDPKWEGGLPYTVLIAPGGDVVYRKHDEIDPLELKREIANRLGRTYAKKKSESKTPTNSRGKEKPNSNQSSNDMEIPKNFQKENLIAWCIVPFDAANRGPAERAEMVKRLGLNRIAYDWRDRHVAEFEEEIEQYQKYGIEYFAFWKWHDAMEPLIKKYGIKPQIWYPCEAPSSGTQEERIQLGAESLLPAIEKAKSLGLSFGLYNHGGWNGEPENMIAVCEYLRTNHAANHVGIVYNFHHGHEDIEDFAETFKKLQPYLLCLNLNGMVDSASYDEKVNKIVPVGSGKWEKAMIRVVIDSGYSGPVGVLGHREELDAKESLQLNLDGLEGLLMSLEK